MARWKSDFRPLLMLMDHARVRLLGKRAIWGPEGWKLFCLSINLEFYPRIYLPVLRYIQLLGCVELVRYFPRIAANRLTEYMISRALRSIPFWSGGYQRFAADGLQ